MEVSGALKERSTAIMAVITLAIMGCSLLASTWQSMLQQKVAEKQHLSYISHSLLLAVESTLRRGPVRSDANHLSPKTLEIFESLEESGEILFAGIVDQRGGQLLMSDEYEGEDVFLPSGAIERLLSEGEWSGQLAVNGKNAFVSGKLLSLVRGQFLTLSESPPAPIFLLVGLDTTDYLNMNENSRDTIIFQASYILGTALLCWFFAFHFLSRRDQAKRGEKLEKFHDRLFDNLPDGLITLDKDTTIMSANPAALTVFNAKEETLVGTSLYAIPSVITETIIEQCQQAGEKSWQRVSTKQGQFEILVLDLPDLIEIFMVIIRDRTKLNNLEKSLADAEKLALVGTLAAGVAHEVRNPLSALRGFAQYFLKKLKGKQPEEAYAKTMVTEADRLNRVITDLLFLAKPKRVNPHVVDLHAMVDEVRSLMRFDMEQKGLSIEAELNADTVIADQDALKQLVINLVLNSFDASSPPCSPVVIASEKKEDAVWIEVRDNGCGMSEEQRQKAFDPFFTAKPRGTGLGLALVQGIMVDHGGKAQIFSQEGKGCTVRLTFPIEERSFIPLVGAEKMSTGREENWGNNIQRPLLDEDSNA